MVKKKEEYYEEEDSLMLAEFLERNVAVVSVAEQEEIDALGIDFSDLTGEEIRLEELL
ncbi:hypothetical protein SAMN05421767_1113 [Granulicatella balaenopterae]|uniref:Uncharacterized protein n=2 Tax=Granulicatella balaenopterae TaxID=137733 RepID=A0A1H9JXK1_9LACT|nr:hypothetical protein SAMN05421767_1113 [Granulicatella balaenopterae]